MLDLLVIGEVVESALMIVTRVDEVTAHAKFAEALLAESEALLSLVSTVCGVVFAQFLVSMSKLAFSAVRAMALLSKFPAQLQFLVA